MARSLERWDMVSNPTRCMDICVRLFCVNAVLLYWATLRRADPPCIKDQETERAAKAQQIAVEL
jgi:hypothetical protein